MSAGSDTTVAEISPVVGAERTHSADGMARLISFAFLGIFGFCLVIPLLQTVYPILGRIVEPVRENRESKNFPPLRELLRADGAFAAGLNAWFDDRAGFRDLFIRAKNQVDYSLFQTSRKVIVGANGWLFFRNGDRGVESLDAASLEKLEQRFITLARELQEKNIRLVLVLYPDKSRVYPEMLPASETAPAPGGNVDKLRAYLAARPDLIYVDAESIMKAEKSKTAENLFAKTDMHPTQIGQLPVVKEIIKRISEAEGRPDIRWDEKLTLAHDVTQTGSEGRFLSVLNPSREMMPYFRGSYEIGGREADGAWYLPDPRVLDAVVDGAGRPFDWEFRSKPELCQQRLPGMVLFGNSFSDFYWALGMHRYFCSIRRARDPQSRFKLFFDTMPADTKYFIYECVLTWLPGDAPPAI
jgi:alginate O-acetyltransferase complex protein AlgJ